MDPLYVHILGTMATAPTAARNVTALMIQHGGSRTLIDCGEGTQRQLRTCLSTGPGAIDRVLITHYHADHYLGLPGFLKTRSQSEEAPQIPIYGPKDVVDNLKKLFAASFTSPALYTLCEINHGDEIDIADDMIARAVQTLHGVPSVGYAFIEANQPGRFDAARAKELGVTSGPDMGTLARGGTLMVDGVEIKGSDLIGADRLGRRVVYSGDTRPCSNIFDEAQGCNLLIHEATFLQADIDLAKKTNHTTAQEAGDLAKKAKAQNLCVIHFSGRYLVRDTAVEAATAFGQRVIAPRDGDSYEIKGDGTVHKAEPLSQ